MRRSGGLRWQRWLLNLLGNAVTHGTADTPIRVSADGCNEMFELSVSNSGTPIGGGALNRLFLPFARGDVAPSRQGLGLGLYLCSEVARAHGGALSVTSTAEETKFSFRMPLA